jgi:rare lipoprotein A
MRFLYAILSIALLTTLPAAAQSEIPRDLPDLERGDAQRYRLAGGQTASGEPYNPERFTAAHAWLPFGTLIQVTFRGRTVTARVNDRDTGSNLVRLSARAADQLGIPPAGGEVEVRVDPGERSFLQARLAREHARRATAGTPVAEAPAGRYTVQLAAFEDEARAISRAGLQRGAWVQRVQAGNGSLFRVVFGLYDSREAASRARDVLRSDGIDGFVQPVSHAPAGDPGTTLPVPPPVVSEARAR